MSLTHVVTQAGSVPRSVATSARVPLRPVDGTPTGLSPVKGAATAIGEASPTAAAAARVLAGTFASLLLTGIRSLQEIGFGVAVGILIAAFVVASSLVPSVTAIIGRQVWWPARRTP